MFVCTTSFSRKRHILPFIATSTFLPKHAILLIFHPFPYFFVLWPLCVMACCSYI